MSDDEDNFVLRSDPEANKYIEGFRHNDIDETRDFIRWIQKGIENNKWVYWGIELKERKQFIGTICLWNFSADRSKAETGYALLSGHTGRGYMTEALIKVIEYGFTQLQLDAIEAYTHQDNLRSTSLLKRCNFKHDPSIVINGGENHVVFVLVKDRLSQTLCHALSVGL